MARVVMLVGRRPDDGRRDQLWEFCRAWWSREVLFPDGVGLFVGYHGAEEGPWNLAAASNRASRAAGDWDVALYAGADVILGSGDQARDAIRQAEETGMLVFAHDHYYSLTEEGTSRVLAGEPPHGSWSETGVHPNTYSSVLALPRSLWDNVGGFDERFRGPWGGEDIAMWAACWAIGGRYDRVTGPVFHLWHVRDRSQREDHPNYPASDALMRRYLAAKGRKAEMLQILWEPGGPLAEAR